MKPLTAKPLTAFPALVLALGAMVPTSFAASAFRGEDDDLRAKLEEKLEQKFVSFGGWVTDYEAARAKARESGKILFTYFSRSYAP